MVELNRESECMREHLVRVTNSHSNLNPITDWNPLLLQFLLSVSGFTESNFI